MVNVLIPGELGRLSPYGLSAPTTGRIPMYDTATGKITYVTAAQIASGANAVDGPVSATDNAIAVYDGTTGKLIKNSTVILTSGALSQPGSTTYTTATSTTILKQGANGKTGTFTANGVTPVTVANTSITANSGIVFTLKTVGGTVGAHPAIQTITPTTGFTVACTAADTSVYNYHVIESAA